MAVLNVPLLRDLAPDVVVSDVITACGGLAAELLGIPWIELNPAPLYRPSKGLPPLGSGLAQGVGIRGRLRDAVMRALTARSWREGLRQRSAVRVEIGLPATDPGPLRRLIATLPALEVPRPDWPGRGRRRRPAALRTDRSGAGGPTRGRPGRRRRTIDGVHRRARHGRGGAGGAAAGGGAARGLPGGGVAAGRIRSSMCRHGRWSASVGRTNCCRRPTW